MNEQQQILYMQIRILRMFSERLNCSLKRSAEIFKEYKVLEYIRQGFGIFHVEGDDAIYEDVKEYLKAKGAEL